MSRNSKISDWSSWISRLEALYSVLLPHYYSPLNSVGLLFHMAIVVFSAVCVVVLGVNTTSEQISCFSQRNQARLNESWKLDLCLQYSGNVFEGDRRVPVAYSFFQYYVLFTMLLNCVPVAVRRCLEHRLLTKFLRKCRVGDDAEAKAEWYGLRFTGVHSGLRKHKFAVSAASFLVSTINLLLLVVVSQMTLLASGNYPFAQYLGQSDSDFGLVFPGTAQCEIQPEMRLGLHTETYGCHFPFAQHYRHIFVMFLVIMIITFIWTLITAVKDLVKVFLPGGVSLVHTAFREATLEKRIVEQWNADELDALSTVRKYSSMDGFIRVLKALDWRDDVLEEIISFR